MKKLKNVSYVYLHKCLLALTLGVNKERSVYKVHQASNGDKAIVTIQELAKRGTRWP